MKTLLDILTLPSNDFKLSEHDKVNYNAQDHPNHKTGVDGKGKKTVSCIYSVYAVNIKDDIAFCQSINAWGRYLEEIHPLSQLVPYPTNDLRSQKVRDTYRKAKKQYILDVVCMCHSNTKKRF